METNLLRKGRHLNSMYITLSFFRVIFFTTFLKDHKTQLYHLFYSFLKDNLITLVRKKRRKNR